MIEATGAVRAPVDEVAVEEVADTLLRLLCCVEVITLAFESSPSSSLVRLLIEAFDNGWSPPEDTPRRLRSE